MPCFYHPDRDAVNTCSRCGQPICSECNHVTGTHPICRTCWEGHPLPVQRNTKTEEAKAVEPKTETILAKESDTASDASGKFSRRKVKIIAWVIAGLWLIFSTWAIVSMGSGQLGGLSGTLLAWFLFSIPAGILWGIVYGIGWMVTGGINDVENWKAGIFGTGIAFSFLTFIPFVKDIITAGSIGLKTVLTFDVGVFFILFLLGIAYGVCSLVSKRKKRRYP